MAGKKKKKVEPKPEEKTKEQIEREEKILLYIKLVKTIRKTKDSKIIEDSFCKIVEMMHTKIQQLIYKLKIPGCGLADLYQEALFALRYKAIKDYNERRSEKQKISPFDNFAILCIRRHLSTKWKSSFQSKSRVQNNAVSLDQKRPNISGEEDVSLSEILFQKGKSVLEKAGDDENYKGLIEKLVKKMSSLEKKVFYYYKQGLSYEEICDKLNKKGKKKIDTKNIDNAIVRFKNKGLMIYQQELRDSGFSEDDIKRMTKKKKLTD